jgi:hypothetical protein
MKTRPAFLLHFPAFSLFIVTMLLPSLLLAQKEDYIWVIGDSNDTTTTNHGGMIIDFNHPSPEVSYHYREMNMYACNASICNSDGELILYSNGCDIADANDEIIENGNTINPGEWHESLCDNNNDGYWAGYPSMVLLPTPETDSSIVLFHKSMKKVNGPPAEAYVDRLLYSKIKITAEGKEVVEKNILLIEDDLSTGELGAVKHANGIDWWIITPKRNSNQFYTFLFTSEGIVDTLFQTIGSLPPAEEEGRGQMNISPDGSKLVRYFPHNPAMLYHFDRETGQFSNYQEININFGNALAFDGGCAFSPSGQFLYIMALVNAYQFDLWSDDISATQTLVAEWDGFLGPIATVFVWSQLGPDCKIYIQCGDMRYYHIIHSPDEAGLACNFEQRGLNLPTPSGASIPYFPNYRLGPIDAPGEPCTPTVGVTPGDHSVVDTRLVKVYPNPASSYLHIEHSLTEQNPSFVLYNMIGQVVLQKQLSGASELTLIDVSMLPSGSYFYRAGNTTSGKVSVQH